MIGEDMASYYKTRDHYKGPTCLLTLAHCDRDCTRCTFAGAAYDNLCLAERTMMPFSQYMKSEDVLKYQLLRDKVLDQLEELSDMLESFDDTMAKKLDVWNKEEEE